MSYLRKQGSISPHTTSWMNEMVTKVQLYLDSYLDILCLTAGLANRRAYNCFFEPAYGGGVFMFARYRETSGDLRNVRNLRKAYCNPQQERIDLCKQKVTFASKEVTSARQQGISAISANSLRHPSNNGTRQES